MEDWQHRRSHLNHDWLKNRYLNRLDGFLALLSSSQPAPDLIREFVEQDFGEWEKRAGEAGDVISSFVREMSPGSYLSRPPLCLVPDETRQWLVAVLHDLWIARTPVSRQVGDAARALDEADQIYRGIQARLETDSSLSYLRQIRGEFQTFRDACKRLGDSIGKMPHEAVLV